MAKSDPHIIKRHITLYIHKQSLLILLARSSTTHHRHSLYPPISIPGRLITIPFMPVPCEMAAAVSCFKEQWINLRENLSPGTITCPNCRRRERGPPRWRGRPSSLNRFPFRQSCYHED
ncbi:hypothetical protein AVEN_229814-1 [Araneus ventricosus]|uniref:Uncharacterized protein n=1 Tax=Araneus ventricosus TaxID=182803 RepID=A0A4Y2T720_ARAVE|nr:hypothetical protein AVEN_229814-1 [Araneus ventricosus]